MARHGKDWVVYPDGLAMAADWQKSAREKIASHRPLTGGSSWSSWVGLKTFVASDRSSPRPLESQDGVCVYFNPEEGMEIIQDFDDLLAGLRKRGTNLTPDEERAIRGWFRSESISPGFVRRLAGEFGSESIKASFMLGKRDEEYALEYLMRRYKGRFYRPRYPTLTLAE